MLFPPPTAGTAPAPGASADAGAPTPRHPGRWGTEHPGTNPHIPALHFPEHLASALPRALRQLHPSGIAVISSSTVALAVFCLTEEIRHDPAAQRNCILKTEGETNFLFSCC